MVSRRFRITWKQARLPDALAALEPYSESVTQVTRFCRLWRIADGWGDCGGSSTSAYSSLTKANPSKGGDAKPPVVGT